ncbi:hypothetical protein [Microbulbifer hainanensis]|uniref:hypothetical protein n=1 Tax=Microbulbifer hainanensis TaxID=2735675 RepID=UPI001867B069|nr:hypothetical protein [Microbulbifer hainanensis]
MHKAPNLLAQMAVFAAIGIAYSNTIVILWGYLAQHNPLFQWMLAHLAGTGWFYPAVWLQDFIAYLMLYLPLALLIFRVAPGRRLLLLAAAVLPYFVFQNWPLFSAAGFSFAPGYLLGWILELAVLPVALLLISRFRRA